MVYTPNTNYILSKITDLFIFAKLTCDYSALDNFLILLNPKGSIGRMLLQCPSSVQCIMQKGMCLILVLLAAQVSFMRSLMLDFILEIKLQEINPNPTFNPNILRTNRTKTTTRTYFSQKLISARNY